MELLDKELSPPSIAGAAAALASYVRRTPVLHVAGADFGLDGIDLVFKLELMQHAGSFKVRGAFANLLRRQIAAAGVVAASGGNHGAAVAFAAMRRGITATIFVPSVASPVKVAQIRAYGAHLEITGERYADALVESEKFARMSGATPIHAYDQVETLLGQATVALEFEQDAPELDSVLIAVGGGGLLGGMAAWYRDRTQLVGVEPELAPTLSRAMAAGQPVDAPAGGVAADSLAPKRIGALAFPIARRFVSEVVLVSDGDIVEAQRALWRVLRVATEPGGAAAFAALLGRRWKPAGKRIGVLLCGANTTPAALEP